MPEEINRILTDAISQWLFVSEPSGVENLRREGIANDQIFFVGNVMIDTLFATRRQIEQSSIQKEMELSNQGYAVVTLHRPSNVDDPVVLGRIIDTLGQLQRDMPIIFPVHPRTRKALNGRAADAMPNLRLVEPLGYLDFMKLVTYARIVLTDSGGIQEETTVLGVPCLTLRDNTERPITVTEGSNVLVGSGPEKIAVAWREALAAPKVGRVPELWDGRAAARILDVLMRDL